MHHAREAKLMIRLKCSERSNKVTQITLSIQLHPTRWKGKGEYGAVLLREERQYRSTFLPLEVEDLRDYTSERHKEIDRNR